MKAIRWKQGDKITKPGAYVDVPIEEYHLDPVAARFVTASMLKRADNHQGQRKGSMAHFWAYCPWNPNHEPPDVDTDALRLGKASHYMAFQPELFDANFAVCPYGDDFRLKDAKSWKDQLPKDLLPLKPREHTTILRMADVLRKDPEARSIFSRGLPEMTFVAKDEATGLWMLTRPDFTPAAPGKGLADYKTAEDASWGGFGRAAFNYDYDLQTALALDVVAASTGEMRPTMWMVVQEKEPPFAVSAHRWDPDQIMYGRRRVRDLLDQIARCIESGEWPAYGPAQPINAPFYVQREIDNQNAAV